MSDTYTPEELDTFRSEGTPIEEEPAPAAPASEEGPSQLELDLRDGAAAAPEGAAAVIEPTTIRMIKDPETGRFVAKAPDLPAPAAPAAGATPVAPAPPPGMVPHAALHAERAKTAEALRNLQLLQARTNAVLAAQAPAPFEMPDMLKEPEKYLEALNSRITTYEQGQHETSLTTAKDNALAQDEAMFTQYTPDYAQASAHYVNSRARELTMFNTPEQARQILTEEVRSIAAESWKRGIPAAESIYKLAQARGYAAPAPGAPAPVPAAQPAAAPTPAVAARPTLPPADGRVDPAAIVASIHAGQEASRSISGSGAGGAAQLNAEALLQMSDDEFAAYLKLGQGKGSNDRFREIAGF
jgi:hypothetical protein